MIDSQNNFDMRGIESAISRAGSSYHKLLLLAGKSGAGKTYVGKTPLDFPNILNSKDILATEES